MRAASGGREGNGGFSLLEALVTAAVLSLGVLGVVAMQVTALRFNQSAYWHSQAALLAHDLLERLRGDRRGALQGAYDGQAGESHFQDCDALPASAAPSADAWSVSAWQRDLACTLPQGRGSIHRDGETVTVRVQWDDSRGEREPALLQITTRL